ncbi:hypothetical protein Q7P37_000341 [Cladosporium fusiforme]
MHATLASSSPQLQTSSLSARWYELDATVMTPTHVSPDTTLEYRNMASGVGKSDFKHSGDGALNANTGPGTQYNHNMSGSHNVQHNYFGGSARSNAQICRDALFFCDPAVDRANLVTAKGERVAGTCEWVNRNSSFKSWLHGDTDRLWISGSPGKGKTMISIFLTQELEKDCQVIYFFCSHAIDGRSTATAVLRGLIWQMTQLDMELALHLPRYLDPEASSTRNACALKSQETLWTILMDMVQDPKLSKPIHCLVDGLDECDDGSRRWLSRKLSSLSSACLLRPAVVSRPLADLDFDATIHLDPDNNNKTDKDIQMFVASKLQELASSIPHFAEIEQYVQSELLDRAKGTFLWVGFAAIELLKCNNTTEVVTTINDLPSGLEHLYSRMLLQMKEADREINARILRWVTLAQETLELRYLGAIISLPDTDPIARDRAIENQVRTCEPFITITSSDFDSALEVHLVHMSARDFLLREIVDSNPVLEEFRIKREETHLELAETCLDQIQQHGPLYKYAIFNWAGHMRLASTLAAPIFEQRVEFGGPCEARDAFWGYRAEQPPLIIACELSLSVWAHTIIANNWWKFHWRALYTQADSGETPLYLAICNKLWTVVDVLLAGGADIDARDEHGRTLLILEIGDPEEWHRHARGRPEVTQTLLHLGATIEARDNSGETALHKAAHGGKAELVRILLDQGLGADMRNNEGTTALHLASHGCDISSCDFERVMEHLISGGADVNATNTYGKTALHILASHKHNSPKARGPMLPRRDIPENEYDEYADRKQLFRFRREQDAFHRKRSMCKALASLLLLHGADMEKQDINGKTVLDIAKETESDDRWLVDFLTEHCRQLKHEGEAAGGGARDDV